MAPQKISPEMLRALTEIDSIASQASGEFVAMLHINQRTLTALTDRELVQVFYDGPFQKVRMKSEGYQMLDLMTSSGASSESSKS